MADRVFVVQASPKEFARGIFVPEGMREDLLEIAKLSPDKIDQVATALESATGFLDDSALERLVGESILAPSAAEAVLSAVRHLRPDSAEETLAMLRRWREADPGRAGLLPDETLTAIEANLPKLIRPFPALERYRKAQWLVSLTGHQTRQIDLICDARPIFDSKRTVIEGFVTQTTLRMSYETQTGESGCIELALSPEMLKILSDKAEKARQKTERLRESIRAWLPDGLVEFHD
jgi:hypothetical protein